MAASAWLYPITGIWYFVRHPFLYPLLRGRLIPLFVLSSCILVVLFLFLYLPQVALMALYQPKGGAWLNATFLVLGEASIITALFFEAFLVDHTQVDIFDAVLINEGYESLVSIGRTLDEEGTTPVKRLGKHQKSATYSPFSFRQIIELILLLPLTFIPWIGVPLFLWLTGYRAGPFQQWRYFKLREFTRKERNEFIRKRRLQYTGFGTVHLVLQLVPPLSMFFLLTTATGSALWAVRLEQERMIEEEVQREEDAEQPPPYTEHPDDPV